MGIVRKRGSGARWLRRLGFHTVFQPVVDLESGEVHGYEALLRGPRRSAWESPSRLFAAAHAVGVVHRLDAGALDLALASWRELAPAVRSGARLFLNVRAATLLAVPDLRERIDRGRRAGDRLVLELSEAESSPEAVALLGRLCASLQGVEAAVDDFGAGYSNLAQVMELRPAYVKMDRKLTRLVADDATSGPAVKGLIDWASRLPSRIVAEGIERPEQLERVRHLGVPLGQGWLLGCPSERPAPPRRRIRRAAARRKAGGRATRPGGSRG
ncbi:MAG: EAL domain-containing protein [Bacillota bacterium]|nr:EAL domain-containing protein [Bacillota bacterium]